MILLFLACASCGAGGDSPLVLYPNEPYKVYAGAAHATGFSTVFPDGTTGADDGPTQRDTVTAAAGAAFLTDFFATAAVPYVTNARDGRQASAVGDPSVEARWTALPSSLLTPDVPQVQLTFGYRRAAGRSVYASTDPDQLDVTSVGFDEARAGVDAWWGDRAFKYGLAAGARFPRAFNAAGVTMEPGRALRTVATVAYDVTPTAKLTTGAVLDDRAARRDDGQAVKDSEEIEHDAFLTGDWHATERLSTRLTLSRACAFGENKNTTRMTTVTFALMGVP